MKIYWRTRSLTNAPLPPKLEGPLKPEFQKPRGGSEAPEIDQLLNTNEPNQSESQPGHTGQQVVASILLLPPLPNLGLAQK